MLQPEVCPTGRASLCADALWMAMQLSWHANTWYSFLSITEWFCFQKGFILLTSVGTASAVRVAIGLTPDWQMWAGRSSLGKDRPSPSVTGTVSLVSAVYLHSYQEYFTSAIHEYSALRKVIIQTNSTAIQGGLCLSQRSAIFDCKKGRKWRKKEALLGSAHHNRGGGQDYLYKTCFSSEQKQNLRTLGMKHWCYCPSRTLSSCQIIFPWSACNGVAGLWAYNP